MIYVGFCCIWSNTTLLGCQQRTTLLWHILPWSKKVQILQLRNCTLHVWLFWLHCNQLCRSTPSWLVLLCRAPHRGLSSDWKHLCGCADFNKTHHHSHLWLYRLMTSLFLVFYILIVLLLCQVFTGFSSVQLWFNSQQLVTFCCILNSSLCKTIFTAFWCLNCKSVVMS